jgi:AraC-like DNA-binding protein
VTLTSQDGHEGYRFSLHIGDDKDDTPWQRYAFDLLSLLSFLRWVLGSDLRPLLLTLKSRDSHGVDLCRALFDCPVKLQATTNCLLFSYADIDLTIPTAHPHLASVHERIADEYLARLSYLETSARARKIILKALPDGEPRRENVARALGLSERTLQRRLKDEGCSFQRLLDEARKELAEKYIAQSDMALAEAAYLLGFEDRSSFFRAAKRWFGTTPSDHRLHLAGKST